MITAAISPGSMGVVCIVADIVGVERTAPGVWSSPVYATNLTKEEFDILKELVETQYGESHGLSVKAVNMPKTED